MIIAKLKNLRDSVFRQLVLMESESEPATCPGNNRFPWTSRTASLDASWFGCEEGRQIPAALSGLAELEADWNAPKLALRTEVQLAVIDRRNSRQG